MAEETKTELAPTPTVTPGPGALAVIPPTPNLPAAILASAPEPRKRRWLATVLLLAGILVAGAGVGYWWLHRPPGLPAGIASGNGRLEADEIDIDTKFAGRIASLKVDEGDVVEASQIVALMDSQDLMASLAKSQALVLQAQQNVQQTMAALAEQRTRVVLAQQELDRAKTLVKSGFETQEVVDQRQQTLNGAIDAVNADIAQAGAAAKAVEAAAQDVALAQVNIAYNTLVAPRAGTISTASPISGRSCRPAAKFSRCSTEAMFTWTSICRPPMPAGPGSVRKHASCWTHIPAIRYPPR